MKYRVRIYQIEMMTETTVEADSPEEMAEKVKEVKPNLVWTKDIEDEMPDRHLLVWWAGDEKKGQAGED